MVIFVVLTVGVGSVGYVFLFKSKTSDIPVTRDNLEQVLLQYFTGQGLVPILRMEGQVPGDTLTSPRFAVVRRSSKCFPGLEKGTRYDATLAEVEWSYGAESGADNTFAQTLNAVAKGRGNAVGRIRFKDAFVLSEDITALQAHFDPTICPELEPIVRERSTPASTTTAVLFVPHKIYYAQPDIELKFATEADGKLSSRAAPAGWHLFFSLGNDKQTTIRLVNASHQPVAFETAFVPEPTTSRRGPDSEPSTRLLWVNADQMSLHERSEALRRTLNFIIPEVKP
jgi:hypothetical protein